MVVLTWQEPLGGCHRPPAGKYLQQSRSPVVEWSFYNPKNPIEVLDVVITHDLNHMKSVPKKLGLWTVNVLSIEDLIKMKNDAGRPQDFEDVRVLEAIRK